MVKNLFSLIRNFQLLAHDLATRKCLLKSKKLRNYSTQQVNFLNLERQNSKMLRNMEKNQKHLFDNGPLNVYEPNVINLGVGAPGTDLLANCCEIFKAATILRMDYELESNESMLFQYGPVSGALDVRAAIAKYFSQMYNSEVLSEDLIITAGASHGLHFILSTLVDFNGYLFVDEVTYMIALDVFKKFPTFKIVPVPLNADGVDIEKMSQILAGKRFESTTKEFWAMYYTIPTYHNPTGISFTPAVCEELVKLARAHDFLILCDDVYNILHYQQETSPKRLFAYDKRDDADYRGNVISNGSFSKIIGPGIRLGWLEVPARVKETLDSSGLHNSGGCFNNYTSGILSSLFELGLAQEHIQKCYLAYKSRMLATCEVLTQELPDGCHMKVPGGGYFIWISMPIGADAEEFLAVCLKEEKIFFIPGKRFAYAENVANNSFRITIAFQQKDILVDAAHRLCAAMKRFLTT